jgi:hypothetical protein
VGEGEPPNPRWLLWAPRLPLGSTELPTPAAAPQTGQFGRSEAEAKLHRLGLDPRTTAASCEAIRGLDHGTLGPRTACSTTMLPKSHHGCGSVFVTAQLLEIKVVTI